MCRVGPCKICMEKLLGGYTEAAVGAVGEGSATLQSLAGVGGEVEVKVRNGRFVATVWENCRQSVVYGVAHKQTAG